MIQTSARRRRGRKRASPFTYIGAGVLATFIILVAFEANTVNRNSLLAAGAAAQGVCEPQYQKCVQQARAKGDASALQKCETNFQACAKNKCVLRAGSAGTRQCPKNPDCEAHCTEYVISEKGLQDCCLGRAEHRNTCPKKVSTRGKATCSPQLQEGVPGGGLPQLPQVPQGSPSQPGTNSDCPPGTCEQAPQLKPTDSEPLPGHAALQRAFDPQTIDDFINRPVNTSHSFLDRLELAGAPLSENVEDRRELSAPTFEDAWAENLERLGVLQEPTSLRTADLGPYTDRRNLIFGQPSTFSASVNEISEPAPTRWWERAFNNIRNFFR